MVMKLLGFATTFQRKLTNSSCCVEHILDHIAQQVLLTIVRSVLNSFDVTR